MNVLTDTFDKNATETATSFVSVAETLLACSNTSVPSKAATREPYRAPYTAQDTHFLALQLLTGLLWGFVAVACMLIISRALASNWYRRMRLATNNSQGHKKERDHRHWLRPAFRFSGSLKRHLTLAPLVGTRRAQSSKLFGVFPTRLQTVFLAVYFIANVLWIILFEWSNPENFIWKQLRIRSGAMAAANMVPLIVLAARNDVLIPLLGIRFDTCNLFHRWIGRIMVLESVVHVMSWAYPKVGTRDWTAIASALKHSDFIRSGLVVFISLLLIFFSSLKPFRSTAYDLFKRIHLASAIVFTIAISTHCTTSVRPKSRAFILTAVFTWAAERLTRWFWLLYRNRFSGRSTTAIVELIPGNNRACLVTMELPRHINIKPGMHSYLRFDAVRAWENHPFSIAWWNDSKARDGPPSTTLSFIIGAQGGFTKSLYDHARLQPGLSFHTDASMEGPYGGHHSLDSYGHAILVAGGTGIAHHISYIRHFLLGKAATRRVVLIWAVRSMECVDWVRPWLEEIKGLRKEQAADLVIRLFITGQTSLPGDEHLGIGIRAEAGRPDITKILKNEVVQQIGAMCVSVCGPGGLADDTRAAARVVQVSGNDIDFVEESFGW